MTNILAKRASRPLAVVLGLALLAGTLSVAAAPAKAAWGPPPPANPYYGYDGYYGGYYYAPPPVVGIGIGGRHGGVFLGF